MNIKPVPFFSGALYRRQSCFVALPDRYDEQPERRYPVLYLLHGMHGCESDWWLKGDAPGTVQRLIGEGGLEECIVVMPSDGGHGLGTFYVNWYDGTGNFEDYMVEELLPFVDRTFRTLPDRRYRAIAGLSMGGYGSVTLALKHPELFGCAGSLSGALGDLSRLPADEFRRSSLWAPIFGPQFGTYAVRYNPFRLSEERKADGIAPYLYINCGREDDLFPHNEAFHRHLDAIGYTHDYDVFPGAHTWEYWKARLPEALEALGVHWSSLES